jgi:predicted phage terminase large subunit-like protein
MIAPRKKSFQLGSYTWHRKKGELLRPTAFGIKEIKTLRASTDPDFDTLYQQNPADAQSLRIKREYFPTFAPDSISRLPTALSVDPGHRGGEGRSYSVIQAWAKSEDNYFLLGQWRQQCGYKELRKAYWAFVRNYDPVVALVETTGNGPALIDDARQRRRVKLVEIVPDGRSKTERLREHMSTLRGRRIQLPESAPWKEEFIAEFIAFPSGASDDQVDATTQYLDWIKTNPPLSLPPPRALMAAMNSRGELMKLSSSPVTTQTPRIGVLGTHSRW